MWNSGGVLKPTGAMRGAESENTSEAVEDLPIWPGADIPGMQIED